MNTIPHFDSQRAAQLKAILDSAERSSDAFTYNECVGFLFVLACSPELINPNEWIPVILDSHYSSETDMKKITKTMELLVGLYNEVNEQVQDARVTLLPHCEFRSEPMDNFAEDAPIRQWARGFIIAHDWQKTAMSEHTPEELDEELGAQMMVLSFFADLGTAKEFLAESKKEGVTIESMAADMQNIFLDAMKGFAHLGKTIQQVLQQFQSNSEQPAKSSKVGRNQPCTCGSGKKYKKCCGSALH